MRKSDRTTRGKKNVSYKEVEVEEVESILSDEESEEKQTNKRRRKKDEESEDFDIEDEQDEQEDELVEEEDEEEDDDFHSEKKAKKKQTGKKRKAEEKIETVVTQVEKKKRGRKKTDKDGNVENKTIEKSTTTVKKTATKKFILDPAFDLEKEYFYLNITPEEETEIKLYIDQYFNNENPEEKEDFKEFFRKFPNLRKNKSNIDLLHNQIKTNLAIKSDNITLQLLERYNKLYHFFLEEYYTYKPVILEAHFFPNPENEPKIVNLIRKAKISLFIAIFALTNDRIYGAIEEVFKRGVPVKIIADDEMAKCLGSDVYKAASLVKKLLKKGIPVKTDNSVKFHMHHKFCVIDESIVITGSFNWTSQAVNFNQENILFYENKDIAQKYIAEFNKLWTDFEITITKEQGDKLIEEENKKKLEYQQKAKETRAKKKLEKLSLTNDTNNNPDKLTHI